MSAITHPHHHHPFEVLTGHLCRAREAAVEFLHLFHASTELAFKVEAGEKVSLEDLRKVGLL